MTYDEELLERCKPLVDEGKHTNAPTGHSAPCMGKDFCRRCRKPIVASRRYCSRDCELFGEQQPFEVLYKQLHPKWPKKRGTESTLRA